MPLSINVGLSRKASKDYQSTGVSINVTAELDQSLLARPQELQAQVADLYAQAEAALERQAANMGESAPPSRPAGPEGQAGRSNGNGHANGNGNGERGYANGRRPNGNGNGSTATDSQRRAIASIARRLGVDAALEARDIIGAELDSLTLRQASELIDHLKALQPVNGRGSR